MFERSAAVTEMMEAARAAGAGLLGHFRQRGALRVQLKGPADFVSAADLDSERTLQAALLAAHPTYGFLTEESVPKAGTNTTARFIVDPLDGTTNFVHGVPPFAIAIALERGRRVVSAVVFDPPKNEMFVAEEGRGAWLGGERLRAANDIALSRAPVATGVPPANRA